MDTAAQVKQERPAALRDLPPFPGVALRLLTLLDRSNVTVQDIEQVLRMDAALSAKILRIANSAFYASRYPIDSLQQATVRLGIMGLKRTALTVALGGLMSGRGKNQALQQCWHHSVAGALISEELAKMLGQSPDRAYTAGLLHDIGRLGLLACYPDRWQGMLEVANRHGIGELEAERDLFGIDHCAAGRWLAKDWNLPEEFVDAIENHHTAEIRDASLLSIVTAANTLANVLGYDTFDLERTETIAEVIEGLPLKDRPQAVERIEGLRDTIHNALSAFAPGGRA